MGLRIFNHHPNTGMEYDRESTVEHIQRRVTCLATCVQDNADRCVFVYSMGAMHESQVRQLRRQAGVEVVWSRSLIPGVLLPLRLFFASYASLLRVTDVSKLGEVFFQVLEKSMAGVYEFSRTLEQQFVSQARAQNSENCYDFGVKADPAYMIYIVDADSLESPTGIYEIASVGQGASSRLKDCFTL